MCLLGWVGMYPQTLRADEDVLTPLPLSELDEFGEMLNVIILVGGGWLWSDDACMRVSL